MGADAFHAFYGVRWEIDKSAEDEVELLERRHDPRQVAARTHKLDAWWGDTIEPQKYFLLVGKKIGSFGWEGIDHASVDSEALVRTAAETTAELERAGIHGTPQWHFQFEPDC